MRIISGSSRGRKLIAPQGNDIRPTSDKIRGAIFNSLRSKIDMEGVAVIDAFCGSGALGLEALSRGAASCAFIDSSRVSLDLAKANAAALKFEDRSIFFLKDAAKPRERKEGFGPAALAFLDPPYNKNLIPRALAALHEGGWLAKGAICVVETEKSFREPFAPPYRVLDEKMYGDTKIFYIAYD